MPPQNEHLIGQNVGLHEGLVESLHTGEADVLPYLGTSRQIKGRASLEIPLRHVVPVNKDLTNLVGIIGVTKWVNFAKGLKVGSPIGPKATCRMTFTLGSHMDDVLSLHGVPDAIERIGSVSSELWHYGEAWVELQDGRVRAWRNSRRTLKVSMTPGAQTTRRSALRSGSTCDDVIRLLGTPNRIDHFDSLDSEIWHYGNSVVTISIAERCVRHWSRGNRNGTRSLGLNIGRHRLNVVD